MAKGVTYDLTLSNKIYKANLESLIQLSEETLAATSGPILQEFIEFQVNSSQGDDSSNNMTKQGSHLANIDWLFLNSIFISFYSYFEHHLFALAKVVEERSKSKITIDDMSGSGINQYLNYLYLVGNIDFAKKGKQEWQIIQKFRKIRNILVHNGNMLNADHSKDVTTHELFNFLISQGVKVAGTLGYLRIRTVDILTTFSQTTFAISDNIVDEINSKYPIN